MKLRPESLKPAGYASVRPHRPCTFASGVLDPLGPWTTAAGPRQHTQPFRPPWLVLLPSWRARWSAPIPACRWRLGLAYVAARLAWRLGAVGRHAGAPPQPVRPPIGAHHATPRSSRRADGSQWTRLPGPRPDRWRRAKTGRGRGGRYLPSPGGVLTYSEWRGTGRAGKEDTRTASREPLKRRLSGPLPMPALDKLDKHHLRPVASEQQRAGQAPSASSSDGARPAGDLRHEERRSARRRRRGGGGGGDRRRRHLNS